MKDFVKENERILTEWKRRYNDDDDFADDGIMFRGDFYFDGANWRRDESKKENALWAKAPLRILYLTKDQNTGGGDAWDVRGETYHYPDENIRPEENLFYRKYAFHRNLVYTLYGLSLTTPQKMIQYDEIVDQKALEHSDNCCFARINVKKIAGSRSIRNNVLRKYLENDRDLIIKQVDCLDADIMVCCGYTEAEGNLILDFLNSNGCSFECVEPDWVYYDAKRNKVAINTWHLSARVSSEYFYTEMIGAYHKFLKKHHSFLCETRK